MDIENDAVNAELDDAFKRFPGVSRAVVISLYTQGLRDGAKKKCSHGDYRMIGTDDCKNWVKCGGRTEIYVIGEGHCLSCRVSS